MNESSGLVTSWWNGLLFGISIGIWVAVGLGIAAGVIQLRPDLRPANPCPCNPVVKPVLPPRPGGIGAIGDSR